MAAVQIRALTEFSAYENDQHRRYDAGQVYDDVDQEFAALYEKKGLVEIVKPTKASKTDE